MGASSSPFAAPAPDATVHAPSYSTRSTSLPASPRSRRGRASTSFSITASFAHMRCADAPRWLSAAKGLTTSRSLPPATARADARPGLCPIRLLTYGPRSTESRWSDREVGGWIKWVDLVRRVFDIDALECVHCCGRLRFVAAIDDPELIRRILAHRGLPLTLPRPLTARRLRSPRGSDSPGWGVRQPRKRCAPGPPVSRPPAMFATRRPEHTCGRNPSRGRGRATPFPSVDDRSPISRGFAGSQAQMDATAEVRSPSPATAVLRDPGR